MTRPPESRPTVDLVLIVPHTHWDREWYLPFERFRMQLVDMIDRLLAIMQADSEFERFTLDGQSIVLDDYLAIRPEQEPVLRQLVQQGRVAVGPWYVLPDEFLVSGEALIRNLLVGRRTAARFGPPMPVGYLPDSFGHVAQLPQILQGFGIQSAMLSRGLGDEGETLGTEFWWEALDGSRVFAVHQVFGYCNLVAMGYHRPSDLFEGRPADPDLAAAHVRREVARLEPYARCGAVLLNNGCDHQPASPDLPRLVGHVRRVLPQWRIRWATPAEAAAELLARAGALGVRRGELRGSRYSPLIPGVLSARLYLKQANEAAQRALEHMAEPWAAIAWAQGETDPRPVLRYAWEVLLQNHPHDSICGCSVDAVHCEMLPRFARAQAVAEEVAQRALDSVAARIDTASLPPGLPLIVFNSLSWSRTDAVRTTLALSARVARAPRVLDADSRPVPVQVLRRNTQVLARERIPASALPQRLWWLSHEIELAWGVRFFDFRMAGSTMVVETAAPGLCSPDVIDRMAAAVRGRRAPLPVRVERTTVELAFVASEVPALGYRTFVVAAQPGRSGRAKAGVTRRGRTLRNEHLEATVDAEGTLLIRHRASGATYRVHLLEDMADVGDEYDYSPLRERPVTGAGLRARITSGQAGPVLASFPMRLPLRLPAGLRDDRRGRSAAQVDCPMTIEVTLAAGSRRVECAATIENRARDHRLRVLFPAGVRADTYAADVQFGVVERPVGVPPGEGWAQPPQPTAPHQSWVDVSDGRRGLAVLSVGLPEHAVVRQNDGLWIALTLLRCVGWLSRDDLRSRFGHAGPGYETPEAQCLGTQQARYAVVPHAGRWQQAGMVHEALSFRVAMETVAHTRHSGTLSPVHSFLSVDGAAISAVKPAESEDAVVVRVYNPRPESQRVVVRAAIPHRAAREVSLAEDDAGPLQADGGRVTLDLRPFQIKTVALTRTSSG